MDSNYNVYYTVYIGGRDPVGFRYFYYFKNSNLKL